MGRENRSDMYSEFGQKLVAPDFLLCPTCFTDGQNDLFQTSGIRENAADPLLPSTS